MVVEPNDFEGYALIIMGESKQQASTWTEFKSRSYISSIIVIVNIFFVMI